ncbi:hypothetical protein L1047_11685 [Synechococcus sp. Nb3U1]|nr:hypothetical protein [Synechococcus sp. Nb3U1]MCF2971855.1 hypothetical protein [Synechococcus sp. Nb3U1]
MALLQPNVTRQLLVALALFVCLGLLPACDEGGGSSTVSPPSITPTPASE